MAAERVKRLKDLSDMVMRLPESPERDRLLSEVRSRVVDVDTGVTPRAMLPLREPVSAPIAAMPKRRTAARPRWAPAPPTFPRISEPAWDEVLGETAHLSLDDSRDASPPHDGRTARPWTLGLRG
jgi:hypothetical protein